MLHGTISFANCLATLEKEIHCKLQETYYTLQSRAATCNGFKKSQQSLQKVERSSAASVTRCNFLCKLSRNIGKRNPLQVARDILHVAISGCNLQWFQKIHAVVTESRTDLYIVQSLQAQESCQTNCEEVMLHATTYPATCLTTPLQFKLQGKFHRVNVMSH